jgi:hypothetical protein
MYAPAIGRASLTERTVLASREVFLGRRRGPLAMLPFDASTEFGRPLGGQGVH